MNLVYSPEAVDDINNIKTYIATVLKNRTAASRITKMIIRSCKSLKNQPMIGAAVEAKTGLPSPLRYLICESWLAFYRVTDNTVQIVRVLDGRTDYIKLLFMQQ